MIPCPARRTRLRRPLALLALALALSCAAPSELARRSEESLAAGDPRRALELASKALDRQPGNARARAAAAASYAAIAEDWRRRILAVADVDTLAAAGQVLEFAGFRAGVARYADTAPDEAWHATERDLRRAAARQWYGRGRDAEAADRPKRAYLAYLECERFEPGFAGAADRAARALERAVTRVAVLPLAGSARHAALGVQVSAHWRERITRALGGPDVRFTRVVPAAEVEHVMTVAELQRLDRDDAVRIARRVGASRVVWGTIGSVDSDTRTDRYEDGLARRVVEKDAEGRDVVRWIEVPVAVVARARTVSVEAEVEVLDADDGRALAVESVGRSLTARTVWTSFVPEGDLDTYALVAEPVLREDPGRVKRAEARWKAVAGEELGVKELLRAARSANRRGHYRREELPRFYPGAAGPVFLDDVPPAEDLAFAALVHGWEPVAEALRRLDAVDGVDAPGAR